MRPESARRSPVDQKIHLKTIVPGPKSVALRQREDAHIAPGLQGYAVMAGIAVDHAVGSAVTDVDGNTFLDFIGGIGVNALGHAHPTVVDAIQRQVARAHVGSFTSEARVDLVERLAAHAPSPELHRVQLYSGGAEAVESALRLAKSHTKKYEFVSFWGGFHGKTLGALSLMGSTYKEGLGPMAPGSHLVPYADCYRCPIGSTYPSCGLGCVDVGRKQLKMAGAGAIAAFIVEPMQGTAGNVIPPDDFLPAVRARGEGIRRALHRRRDDHRLRPHGQVVGRRITPARSPTSSRSARPSAAASRCRASSPATRSPAPSRGASRAARRRATEATRSALPRAPPPSAPSTRKPSSRTRATSARSLIDALRPFVDDYPFVGEVRGRGLLIGIELVRDKKTKEPLSRTTTRRIFDECVRRGLLTMAYAPSFRIQPALTIDRATAANGVAVLREVFDLVKRERLWEAEQG